MNKNTFPSISENNGLALITEQDRRIYSVGISTGGTAEIRMATASPERKIIATTIDQEGAKFAQRKITEAGLLDQIKVKIEDVSAPLPYLVSDCKNTCSYLHPDFLAGHSAERAGSLDQAVKRERVVQQDKDGSNKNATLRSDTK